MAEELIQMWEFFILPALVFWPALMEKRKLPLSPYRRLECGYGYFVACLMILFIGWRHEVGGDWISYWGHVEEYVGEGIGRVALNNDPAYNLLNWIGANFFGGVYFVNITCAAIFTWGLFTFCGGQPRPWLAVAVAIPYLVTVVAMGYTRQSVAIALTMVALNTLINSNSLAKTMGWIALAAAFHKSAILMIPVAFLSSSERRWPAVVMVGSCALLLFVVFLQDSMNQLVHGYVKAEYASSGAAIRVFMNALPGLFFLIEKKRFRLSLTENRLWSLMSAFAVVLILLLVISPSSTAVDRIALFLIPLQLFVWSRFPEVVGSTGQRNVVWVSLILLYSVTVLTVWLLLGDFSYEWLPYQFYPWIWLWS